MDKETISMAGLFGIDPSQYRSQQAEQDERKALMLSQLSPQQISMNAGLNSINRTGRAVGSLLGVQDPELQENAKLLAVRKQAEEMGIDKQSPEGWKQYAQLLDQAGLPEKAMMAIQRAQHLEKMKGESDLVKAKTGQITNEAMQEQMFRQALQELGPNATQEQLAMVAAKFGSPDKVMAAQQSSLDRKAAMEERMSMAKQKLEQDLILARERGADRKELMQMQMQGRKDMAMLAASMRQPRAEPAITPVTIADPNDPDKQIVVDGRTMRKIGDSGRLSDSGKANAKQNLATGGLGGAIQEAKDLLMGVRRDSDGSPLPADMPTGSGIGSLIDSAASIVGISPKGAAEADRLKVVAAKLTSSVPRFEGPQSDADTKLYKQAAADVGNEKLPRDRRIAALGTMETLTKKAPSSTKKASGPTLPPGFKED